MRFGISLLCIKGVFLTETPPFCDVINIRITIVYFENVNDGLTVRILT